MIRSPLFLSGVEITKQAPTPPYAGSSEQPLKPCSRLYTSRVLATRNCPLVSREDRSTHVPRREWRSRRAPRAMLVLTLG